MTVGRDGRIIESNPAVEPVFGYTQEAAVGKPIGELLALPEPGSTGWATVAGFLAGGRSAEAGNWEEVTGLRADGDTFLVEVSVSRGELPGRSFFAAYIRDISERRRAEEERLKLEQHLGQAQKIDALGRLAGGVAHDFNNLLTVIVGHTELLLDAHPEGDPDHDALVEITETADHAAALIGQVLTFSRSRPAERRNLDLNAAVSDLAPLLRRLVGGTIELTLHCDPDLGDISAEPVRIDQVILNLAANARDAMPDGGQLKTRPRRPSSTTRIYRNARVALTAGPYAVLSVSDDGVGWTGRRRSTSSNRSSAPRSPEKTRGESLAN